MKPTTHRWNLAWEKEAEKTLRKLSSDDRRRVFDSLVPLLRAGNPCAVLGVEKLKSSGCIWKLRRGDYRIFFEIESVTFHIYKGTLTVTSIALHHTGY